MRSREPAPETIFPGSSLTAAIPAGFPGVKMKKCFRASCSDMSTIWMRTEIRAETLKQGDNYTIQQSHDRFAGMDYVECWGQLDEEHYFIIRTPLESIRESADISNKFYFAVGLMIIILSGLVIMVVTRTDHPSHQ